MSKTFATSGIGTYDTRYLRPQYNYLVNPMFNLWFNGTSSSPTGYFTNNCNPTRISGTTADALMGGFAAKFAITSQYGGGGQSIQASQNTLLAGNTYTVTYRYKADVTSANLRLMAGEGDGSYTYYNSKLLTSATWAIDSFTFTIPAGEGHNNGHPVNIQVTDWNASGFGTVTLDWIVVTNGAIQPNTFPVPYYGISDTLDNIGAGYFLGDFWMPADKYLHFGGASMYYNSTYKNVAINNSVSGGGFQMQSESYMSLQRTSDYAQYFKWESPNLIKFFPDYGNESGGVVQQYAYITAASGVKYVQWLLDDTDDYFHLSRQDTNILGFKVDMPITTSGLKKAVVTKTADYTATTNDEVIVCNKTTAMTITLPAAKGSGQTYAISSINIGAVTVDGNAAETINGDLTQIINRWETIQVTDYASGAWVVI